ncbi:glycosyltransferase [Gordonia polyisoprenivorans]|uniref:glycosyltransferase n=1 Tax=Gordonia polyisoprenivorans TaxID=84595 RepID=UPI000B99E7A3|nr:hypothetical protein CJJ17_23065 [Gordonia polyisoprenivorans]
MIRHRAILPSAKVLQTHRSDVGLLSPYVVRHDYHAHLIHTQSAGMTQTGTDSLWRYGSRLHARIETQVIEKADGIAVFNPVYGDSLASTNARAASFPTWFDPQDLPAAGTSKSAKSANRILWVGRFETPKNPLLALDAFEQLNQISSDGRWEMVMIGDGTMMEHCRNRINSMPKSVAQRISLTGAIPRAMVADEMSNSRVLLMTSNPGYEGYPRVMVEALAAGMSIASTLGADTGGLIENGINGQKTGADRRSLAEAIVKASSMSSQSSVDKVAGLRADVVVHDLLTHLSPSTGLRDC